MSYHSQDCSYILYQQHYIANSVFHLTGSREKLEANLKLQPKKLIIYTFVYVTGNTYVYAHWDGVLSLGWCITSGFRPTMSFSAITP